MKYILTTLNEHIESKLVDFDSFPISIQDTLFNEYGDFAYNFDWNKKISEFDSSIEFNIWRKKNQSKEFLNNLDNIIQKTTKDMILIKKREIAAKKLKAFEEIIISALGKDILAPALSKYEELVLMNPNVTVEDIESGLKKAKDIIDSDGDLNQSKIEPSDIFTDDVVSIIAFENFVEKNPEFKGVFNDWKSLLNDYLELESKKLYAFRETVPLDKIRELRNFLIDFKKK